MGHTFVRNKDEKIRCDVLQMIQEEREKYLGMWKELAPEDPSQFWNWDWNDERWSSVTYGLSYEDEVICLIGFSILPNDAYLGENQEQSLYAQCLVVHPHYRHESKEGKDVSGIGTAMIAWLGQKSLAVETTEGRITLEHVLPAARKFYLERGFREVECEPDYLEWATQQAQELVDLVYNMEGTDENE